MVAPLSSMILMALAYAECWRLVVSTSCVDNEGSISNAYHLFKSAGHLFLHTPRPPPYFGIQKSNFEALEVAVQVRKKSIWWKLTSRLVFEQQFGDDCKIKCRFCHSTNCIERMGNLPYTTHVSTAWSWLHRVKSSPCTRLYQRPIRLST